MPEPAPAPPWHSQWQFGSTIIAENSAGRTSGVIQALMNFTSLTPLVAVAVPKRAPISRAPGTKGPRRRVLNQPPVPEPAPAPPWQSQWQPGIAIMAENSARRISGVIHEFTYVTSLVKRGARIR